MTDDPIILLWGLRTDDTLMVVHDALIRRRANVLLLDQRQIANTHADLTVQPDSNTLTGTLRTADQSCDLRQIRSVYLRPQYQFDLPIVARAGPNSPLWQHAATVQNTLMTWAELTPALVANRPSAMAPNYVKPWQSAWIASLGFRIPDTLITTDPAAALDFWHQHTDVIYKSISGARSIVSRLRPEHHARLENLTSCPTQFQQYIPGIEHRVHVVGDQVFAHRILCDADDYRYADDRIFEICELPPAIADRCRTMAATMNLVVSGIDLRYTPTGDWYCFEVNPAPGFTLFETEANPRIAEAIASLLATAPNPSTA
jgi:hypothetical protein